jgi:heavy metal sensor kinase
VKRFGPLSIRTRLILWYTTALLVILLVISALSYSVLAWSLRRDVDALLISMAKTARDTSNGSGGPRARGASLLTIFGVGLHDTFFQLFDSEGRQIAASSRLAGEPPRLSALARRNAARGRRTFETMDLGHGQRVRLVTYPLTQTGELLQIGTSTHRTDRALTRYAETLVVVVPLGVALAAVGGAAVARVALRPVDQMSSTARRITAEDLARRLQARGAGDELDRLAETLNGMLARLEGQFIQLRRFAADAAHELRTPLTALRGPIEVALRTERSVEEYRRVLASSLEEVEHLIRLAEDLLLLSRASAGPALRREPIDLEALVMEALDLGVRLSRGTGVSVRLGELVPLTSRGDTVALSRAVLNLIENAVKYTPRGGRVELSLTATDGAALLSVHDTGPGIDPLDQERIFEPFVRLDAARGADSGGAGLGLPIARTIVTSHGGELLVASGPGAGCRFTIRLPLAEPASCLPSTEAARSLSPGDGSVVHVAHHSGRNS